MTNSSTVPVIRTATTQDSAALSALAAELGYTVGKESACSRLSQILAHQRDFVCVAEYPKAGVVGWLHAAIVQGVLVEPYLDVAALVVTRERRGRGIGRKLLDTAAAWGAAHGCAQMRVRTNVTRTEAHGFYEHLGFRREKSQHVYLRDLK